MTSVKFDLKNADGTVVETVGATFDSTDMVLLRQFVSAMQRVRDTSLLRRGLPAITNLSFGDQGFKLTCKPYTDPELYELLHVLRPVMLFREATSFDAIFSLLQKRFASRVFSDHAKSIRYVFENGELAAYMQFHVNSYSMFDKSLLDTWLNGMQYHTDEKKAAQWLLLEGALKVENARALVMNQIYYRVKALLILQDLVDMTIRCAESMPPR